MPKWISEKRRLLGMDRDNPKEDIKNPRYYDAENINLTPNHKGGKGAASPALGSEFAIDLGAIAFESDDQDYKGYRMAFDLRSAIPHTFSYYDGITTTTFTISSAALTPQLRYNALKAALLSNTVAIFGDLYIDAPDQTVAGVVHFGFRAPGVDYIFTEEISGLPVQIQVIHEFIGIAGNGYFQPLKSIFINSDLYLLSSNSSVFRFGVAQKNFYTGAWTYTILLQTKQLVYNPVTAVIDLDGEIDFDSRVSLYFTGRGYKPRTLYVKLQTTWEANSALIYNENPAYIETGNPDGYYIYNTIENETSLQLLENFATVSNLVVNDGGGTLSSGNKTYLVQQLSGDEAATVFSEVSNPVSIFFDSTTNPRLYGSTGGSATNKSVSVTVTGLNPELYDKFRLIVINNIDGVPLPRIVDTYDITGIEMTVLHTGSETGADITIAEINAQQIIFDSAGNLVIGRNRLVLSDVQVRAMPDFAQYIKDGLTVETVKTPIDAIGATYATVNEFQKNTNIYNVAGYQYYEMYRIGVRLRFNDGFVPTVYFGKDHRLDDIPYELADVGAGEVYTYGLRCTMDFTGFPDYNGLPFIEALHSYEIVRQPLIQEVTSGAILPGTATYVDEFVVGEDMPAALIYTEGATSLQRRRLGFLCPDILFGISPIEKLPAGAIIKNYGQPIIYNSEFDTNTFTPGGGGTGLRQFALFEFDGDISGTSTDLTTNGESQLLPFNTDGTVSILGLNPDNQVPITSLDRGGTNQKMSFTGTIAANYALKKTANTDHGFYMALVFQEITDKYGEETNGSYISTGHVRTIESGTLVYTDDVFGGDTFTQKTFIHNQNNRNYTTIDTILQLTAGSGLFTAGQYDAVVIGELDEGGYFLAGSIESIALPSNSPPNYSGDVTITWTAYQNVTYHLYVDRPGDGKGWVLVYSGTNTNFVDDNSVVGSEEDPPAAYAEIHLKNGISFYSQNKGNYQLRLFPEGNDNSYPYTTTSLIDWLEDNLDEGILSYSLSYSPLNTYQLFSSFNADDEVALNQPNIAYYSEPKLTGEASDPYRMFLPLNRKVYPAKYGRITNTFLKDMNFLVVGMEGYVFVQALDQQQNQVYPDGTAITIGDGTYLGARELPLTSIGMPIKTGALQFRNSAGSIFIAWFNPYLKKLPLYTGQLKDIGENDLIQSFLTDNNNLVLAEKSIHMGHDFINDELLICAINDIVGSVEYDSGDTYAEGDIVYSTNSVKQRQYFIARTSVPINTDPEFVPNQLQYWEKYRQSNYLLSYNYLTQSVSGFYNYAPLMFLPFQNTFLTHVLQDAAPIDSFLYEHNKGLLLYGTIPITAYVTVIFNSVPDYEKAAKVIFADINERPYWAFVRARNTMTYNDGANFQLEVPLWGATVRNDATISADNPTGVNYLLTAWLEDKTLEVTIFFNNNSTDINILREVMLQMEPLPKFYDS